MPLKGFLRVEFFRFVLHCQKTSLAAVWQRARRGCSHKPGRDGQEEATTVVTQVRDAGGLEQGGSRSGEEKTVVRINDNCILNDPSPAS